MISFDEFKKAEIKIGTILSAEKVPDSDKLIKFMIDLGPKVVTPAPTAPLDATELVVTPEPEQDIRQILSGIAEYYPDPAELVGKQVPVLANLPTRTIRGLESQGMVLYVVGEGFLTTMGPGREVPSGTPVR